MTAAHTAHSVLASLRPAQPVEVAVRRWRVHAVIPCYNRRSDAELLLNDLAEVVAAEPAAELRIALVDNASDEPLSSLAAPPGLRVEHVRLASNTGGSGGFNAGIERVLAGGVPCDADEFIWLLDSDARVGPGTLGPLLRALEADPGLVAVGSALADETGRVFEVGGHVSRRLGEFVAPEPDPASDRPVPAEYVAACSLLARRWAVERAGLMADLFLNGDDVEWCLRLARVTGGRVAAVPASVARHPPYDRMRTGARYYGARNTFAPMAALGLGPGVRLRRAAREVARALSQTLVGRDDLAELHLAGLRDAVAGVRGPGAPPPFERFTPWARLIESLRPALSGQRIRRVVVGQAPGVDGAEVAKELRRLALAASVQRPGREAAWGPSVVMRGLVRLVTGPPADLAVVSARSRPRDWLAGRALVTAAPEGFVIRRIGRRARMRRVASALVRGAWLTAQLTLRAPKPPGPAPRAAARRAATLSIVILTHNRLATLESTLARLARDEFGAARGPEGEHRPEVIVVDNASTDGTSARIAAQFPDVRVIRSAANAGVEGYNIGVAAARGEVVLILDDDSWPDRGAIDRALGVLADRPEVAAVALHPRHPGTRVSEWPFAERTGAARADWPIMGCGNLVRRSAWLEVGGYEGAFFLYRNDTDLALKLLGAGKSVWFDPSLVVWHESPAAATKSLPWFEWATRNWVWMARRHGRGWRRPLGLMLGWAWAHRRAGGSWRAHRAVLRGATAGLRQRPPMMPGGVSPDGRAWARLLRLRA